MKQFLKSYLRDGSDVSSRRTNVAIFIILFIVLSAIALFTKWVKSEHMFDVVMDAIMFIIVGGTLGVSATDIFRRKGAPPEPVKPDEPDEPEPAPVPPVVPPTPEVKPPAPVDLVDVDLDFLRKEEGLRLEAYQCSARAWTIGYGNRTHPDGRPVRKGDKITKEQADEYLIDKCKKILAVIKLPEWMNRNKRTAILSWVFNCGEGAWQKSMLRKLVLEKAPMEKVTQRWTSKYLTAQGSSKPILKPRRIREVTLYYTP